MRVLGEGRSSYNPLTAAQPWVPTHYDVKKEEVQPDNSINNNNTRRNSLPCRLVAATSRSTKIAPVVPLQSSKNNNQETDKATTMMTPSHWQSKQYTNASTSPTQCQPRRITASLRTPSPAPTTSPSSTRSKLLSRYSPAKSLPPPPLAMTSSSHLQSRLRTSATIGTKEGQSRKATSAPATPIPASTTSPSSSRSKLLARYSPAKSVPPPPPSPPLAPTKAWQCSVSSPTCVAKFAGVPPVKVRPFQVQPRPSWNKQLSVQKPQQQPQPRAPRPTSILRTHTSWASTTTTTPHDDTARLHRASFSDKDEIFMIPKFDPKDFTLLFYDPGEF
jgi:hypothetical protein